MNQEAKNTSTEDQERTTWNSRLVGKIASGAGMVMAFSIAMWISNMCTGKGNLLFPPNEDVLRKRYAPNSSSSNGLDWRGDPMRTSDSGWGARNPDYWQNHVQNIRSRVSSGDDLDTALYEETHTLMASADSLSDMLKKSGFWPYVTESERLHVLRNEIAKLPGGGLIEFLSILRVRRFKDLDMWQFMTQEQKRIVSSSAFDEMSYEDQMQFGKDLILEAMTKGWQHPNLSNALTPPD